MSKVIKAKVQEWDNNDFKFPWWSLVSTVVYNRVDLNFVSDHNGLIVESLMNERMQFLYNQYRAYLKGDVDLDSALIHNLLTFAKYDLPGKKYVPYATAMKLSRRPLEGTYKHGGYTWDYGHVTRSNKTYGYAEAVREDGRYNISVSSFWTKK